MTGAPGNGEGDWHLHAAEAAARAHGVDPEQGLSDAQADALRLRNEILLGGLTLLPQATSPPAGDRALPGGVFAIPQLEPRKLPPVLPDDE